MEVEHGYHSPTNKTMQEIKTTKHILSILCLVKQLWFPRTKKATAWIAGMIIYDKWAIDNTSKEQYIHIDANKTDVFLATLERNFIRNSW